MSSCGDVGSAGSGSGGPASGRTAASVIAGSIATRVGMSPATAPLGQTPEDKAAIKIQLLARSVLSRRLFDSPRRHFIQQTGANVATTLSQGLVRSLQTWLLRLGWSKVSGILLSTFMAGYVARAQLASQVTHLQVALILEHRRLRRDGHNGGNGGDEDVDVDGSGHGDSRSLQFDDMFWTPLGEDRPLEVVFPTAAVRKPLVRAASTKALRAARAAAKTKSGAGRGGDDPQSAGATGAGGDEAAEAPAAVAAVAVAAAAAAAGAATAMAAMAAAAPERLDNTLDNEDADARVLNIMSPAHARAVLDAARHFVRSLFAPGALAYMASGEAWRRESAWRPLALRVAWVAAKVCSRRCCWLLLSPLCIAAALRLPTQPDCSRLLAVAVDLVLGRHPTQVQHTRPQLTSP
jgi:hypothetical protein